MAKKRTVRRGKARTKSKMSPERTVVYGIGALAVGGALFYAGKKLLDKNDDPYMDSPDVNVYLPAGSGSTKLIAQRNDNFPLRKGSKGPRVLLLQQALERILGKEVLSRYTRIDGDWGPKTEEAVKLAKLPTIIDEATFNRLTGNASALPAMFNPRTLSAELHNHAAGRNLEGVLSVLRQLKTVADYSAVNKYFIAAQVFSVSRSIVTYLLDETFHNDSYAKERVRSEFRRIGLVERSGKWSLAGIQVYRDLITIKDTYVIDKSGNRIPVKRNTILGEEVIVSNGMTWFNSVDGRMHSVPTQHVKYA